MGMFIWMLHNKMIMEKCLCECYIIRRLFISKCLCECYIKWDDNTEMFMWMLHNEMIMEQFMWMLHEMKW
jgi:hypothetical protein